jgi:hypothetical protein
MSDRRLLQGTGWRIGLDPSAPVFVGLLGGDDWAIELTGNEFQDFCRLSRQLAHTMQSMANQLMDAERICCEAESELLWVETEGFPHVYSLRFMLLSGRRGDGFWAATAVPALLQAMDNLDSFWKGAYHS